MPIKILMTRFSLPNTLKARISWAAWFIFANAGLAVCIATRYLAWMSIPDTGTALYVALLFVGQFTLLAWLPGSLLVTAALLLKRPLLTLIGILLATAGQLLLLLDTFVYSQYRFHLSGFVLELLLGAGSQIFSFSWLTWALSLLGMAAMIAVQAVLAWFLWHRRPRAAWLGALLGLMLAAQAGVHGWHAWADATYDTRITAITRHVPLYHGATAKRFFQKRGLVDAEAMRHHAEVSALGAIGGRSALNYPTEPLACEEPKRPLNILLIAIESLRADMLDPRWLPNIFAFAERALVFRNHYSNGNATKPGIFSLFYGLPASYWDAFTASATPPVLMQRMQQLGYDMKILASATLVSPAFDRNAFAGIKDLRLNTPGNAPWQRDEQITSDWLSFTDAYVRSEQPQPFFGFLFYDTTHSYRVPDDYPRVEPYWKTVNQLELGPNFDPEPYLNVYRTTARYTDELVQRVLQDLEAKGLLDDTIVIITSDHGQEFNDNRLNYWGHGSNFSDYQLKVPMVIHWPGKSPAVIDHLTEHFDVAPTLLQQALGCEATPAQTISSGNSLFASPHRSWSIAHSYMSYALLVDDLQVVTHPAGSVEILKRDMTPAPKLRLPADIVADVLKELSRFYK